jgi:hypothetical protein
MAVQIEVTADEVVEFLHNVQEVIERPPAEWLYLMNLVAMVCRSRLTMSGIHLLARPRALIHQIGAYTYRMGSG